MVEITINSLESHFEKTEIELRYIQNKLKSDFSSYCPKKGEVNPLDLMDRIKRLEQELPTLKRDCEEILQTKLELMGQQAQLIKNISAVQNLCFSRGLIQQDEETFNTSFQNFATIVNGWNKATGSSQLPVVLETAPVVSSGQIAENPSPKIVTPQKMVKKTKLSEKTQASPQKSVGVQPLTSKTPFQEISNDEFLTVSPHIRLRAKLSDINELYKLLFDYFKSGKNTAISTKEIVDLGGKVSGQTGLAKIQTLKALNKIECSKLGIFIPFAK